MMTPLGSAVAPEVKTIWAMSSGLISTGDGGPRSREVPHSKSAKRQAGASSACGRTESPVRIARASTIPATRFTKSAELRKSIGTAMTPSSRHPHSAAIHSGRFSDQNTIFVAFADSCARSFGGEVRGPRARPQRRCDDASGSRRPRPGTRLSARQDPRRNRAAFPGGALLQTPSPKSPIRRERWAGFAATRRATPEPPCRPEPRRKRPISTASASRSSRQDLPQQSEHRLRQRTPPKPCRKSSAARFLLPWSKVSRAATSPAAAQNDRLRPAENKRRHRSAAAATRRSLSA